MSRQLLRHVLAPFAAAAFSLAVSSPLAAGQCGPTQLQKIDEGSHFENFGYSCAIDGEYLVVGTPESDSSGLNSGAVLIRRRYGDHWNVFQLLNPDMTGDFGPGLSGPVRFGSSVAISGHTLLVGMENASLAGASSGGAAIYEFENGLFRFKASIVGSTTAAGDSFGSSAAVHNDVIVIGAPGNDTQGVDSGAVYIFERRPSGWVEVQALSPTELDAGDEFGAAVSAHGAGVIVGAPKFESASTPTDAGRVFGYRRRDSGWLSWSWGGSYSPLPAANAYFGSAVDLRGSSQAVAASGHGAIIFPPAAELPGKVYVWERGLLTGVIALGPWSYLFGASVAIDGNDLVVGAPGSSSALIYRPNGANWQLAFGVSGADTVSGDSFGAACDLVDGTLVVGAPRDDNASVDSGSAFVFDLDGITNVGPCIEDEVVALAGSATLELTLGGPQPQSTAWRRNGVPLIDGGHVSGATTSSLTISPCGLDDEGEYDAVVTNACGAVTSVLASLSVVCGSAEQLTELASATPDPGDNFGGAVDLDGQRILVAAPYDDNSQGFDAGSIRVFEETASGWSDTWLKAQGGDGDDRFGYDVALSGDRLLAGAPWDEIGTVSAAGTAQVFSKSSSGWTHSATLNASDYATNNYFGRALDLEGEVAVVGAYKASQVAIDAGAVYVFRHRGPLTSSDWTQEAVLHASNAAQGDFFGAAVSIGCDRVVVGAEGSDALGVDSGAAYVFRHVGGGSWIQEANLLASDGAANDRFGTSVAIAEDRLLVGAPYDDDKGAVYVFRRSLSTWVQEQKLTAFDGASGDKFGIDVSIDGDVVVVGAMDDDAPLANSGSTYIYLGVGGSWGLHQKVHASDGLSSDRFGATVAVSGRRAVVGAYLHDAHPGPIDAGAAYLYDFTGERPATYCTAKTNSLGCVPAIGSSGTPSVSGFESFLVGATNVLNNKSGLLFYGLQGAASSPFQGGTLCVGAPTSRTLIQDSGGNSGVYDCSGSYSFDFNALVANGSNPALIEGADVWAQYWTRDPLTASSTGLTDGLHFVLFP